MMMMNNNQTTNFTLLPLNNLTMGNSTVATTTLEQQEEQVCAEGDHAAGFRSAHLWLLMIAVIFSRLTLWGADLSVNQGLVEFVQAKERGQVNGVQGSLNQLIDLVRLAVVIALPLPSQFGFLVFCTFFCILAASIIYAIGAPSDDDGPPSK